MNNYQDQSENEPVEQVIYVTINDEEHKFFGDDLTSPISEAIIFLQEQQQKELEL
ncbi:MAG: hypothetical protein V3R25_06040 [Nitrosomonadaceae bacterium]